MLRKKYLYGVDGIVSYTLPNSAEIEFNLDGAQEYALLKKGSFYHDGRLLPDNAQLSKYIRVNAKVKLSCHVLDREEQENGDYHHRTRPCNWYATICWICDEDRGSARISMIMGLYSIPCAVDSLSNRHGVATLADSANVDYRIEFLASKFYLHGKRYPTSKPLAGVLNKYDTIYCDAVPCMKEESRSDCGWFAACAFQGKRPRLAQFSDATNEISADYLGWVGQKIKDPYCVGDEDERIMTNLKSEELLKVINLCTNDARMLFTTGYGHIFDILNDEFGIILGCFKLNVFQTILFHRRNAFLFKVPLARSNLSEIFVEGDRMRFIAVGAPPNFVTDWIAVQVSVAEYNPDSDVPSFA